MLKGKFNIRKLWEDEDEFIQRDIKNMKIKS